MVTVYALYNPRHDKIYVGQTVNLDERVGQHNDHDFCHTYTSRFDGRWVVIYTERVTNRNEALVREKQLKSYRGREFIRKQISLVAQR
ncbi:MAG: GIY-YIG nuclease family protein [Candidatus Roizmanbacteria bacterium]